MTDLEVRTFAAAVAAFVDAAVDGLAEAEQTRLIDGLAQGVAHVSLAVQVLPVLAIEATVSFSDHHQPAHVCLGRWESGKGSKGRAN